MMHPRGSAQPAHRRLDGMPSVRVWLLHLALTTASVLGAAEGYGLRATYYPTSGWFGGTPVSRMDPTVDLAIYPPPPAEPAGGQWSVIWTGALVIPAGTEHPCRIAAVGDAGVEVLIDGVTVLGNWSVHPVTITEGAIQLLPGAHHVEVRAFHDDAHGQASLQLRWSLDPHTAPVPIPASALLSYVPPAQPGSGTGLDVTYYEDQVFTMPAQTELAPTIDATWGTDGPGHGLPGDRFAVMWRGWLEAPQSQLYTFGVTADDGAELWLDGVRVVGDLAVRSGGEATGSRYLVGGQRYPIEVRYRQLGDDAHIAVTWSGALLPRQAIPTERLYPQAIPRVWTVPARTSISPLWSEFSVVHAGTAITAQVGDQVLQTVTLDGHHVALTSTPVTATELAAGGTAIGVPLQPGSNTLRLREGSDSAAVAEERTVIWEALDVRQGTSDTPVTALRVGDALLVTASGPGSVMRLEAMAATAVVVEGASTGTPGTAVVVRAVAPGQGYVRALIDDQEVGRIAIAVVSSAWRQSSQACQVGFQRQSDLLVADPAAAHAGRLWVGASDSRLVDASLDVPVAGSDPGYHQVRVRALGTAASAVQVRLGGPSGPLVCQTTVQPFRLRVTTEAYIPVIDRWEDGSRVVEGRVELDPALPGLDIRLGIFTGGAAFPDGTWDRYVRSDDLLNGWLIYPIVVAPEAGSYVCHVIQVHQSGAFVGHQ